MVIIWLLSYNMSYNMRAVIQTVVSLKLHAMSMRPYTTVWMTARTVRTVIRTVVSCFLTRASMGKSNYYDKMKWQDYIKVIITQRLHQIRNWEFHNYVERNVHYRNDWKSQNRKFDRKSGDTTVRMTADDIPYVPIKITIGLSAWITFKVVSESKYNFM